MRTSSDLPLNFPPAALVFLVISSILLNSSNAFAQHEVVQPNPFRRDREQLEGREYTYGLQGFLDRFSYRFDPENRREWEETGQGFRITGGSVSKDETYVVSEFNQQIAFNETIFGAFRFVQDEDFDSDYSYFLYGLGFRFLEHWSVAGLTNVFRDKEDIDIQLELKWEEFPGQGDLTLPNAERPDPANPRPGSYLRFAVVLTDRFFNESSEVGNYTSRPNTYFLEGKWHSDSDHIVHSWINYTPEAELVVETVTADYDQFTAGLRTDFKVGEETRAIFFAFADYGTRGRTTAEQLVERDLERDNFSFTAEVWQRVSSSLTYHVGARYLYFTEDDLRPLTPEDQVVTKRDEKTLFGGVKIWLTEKFVFRPVLFLNFVDNSDSVGAEPIVEEFNEMTGRVLLPLEYHFPYYNAKIAINPTLEWPGDLFGGLNIQVQFSLS